MAQFQLEPEDAAFANDLVLLQACTKFKGFLHRTNNNYDMALLIYNMQITWHSGNSLPKAIPYAILKLCFRHAIGESEYGKYDTERERERDKVERNVNRSVLQLCVSRKCY